MAPPTAYANYQNCTVVQSHIPCSSYGTCGTLTPKTLIFPVSVQVRTRTCDRNMLLFLFCSSNRRLCVCSLWTCAARTGPC